MCDPVTMAVLTVASTASSLYAQQEAADAQADANRENYKNQMTAYRYNTANANATKVQESENLSAKKMEINADVMRKQATAAVAAGEAGVSGMSVDGLLASIGAEGGRAAANAEVNYLRTDRAIETDKMNMWAGTASNIGQMKTPTSPDYMGAALKIGTAVDKYKRGT
jgi:hypothetical protein